MSYYHALMCLPFAILAIGTLAFLFGSGANFPFIARRIGIPLLLIGSTTSLVILFFHFTYPSVQELEDTNRLLFSGDSRAISSLIIEPLPPNAGGTENLVHSPVSITHEADIKEVMSAMSRATRFAPNHPGVIWTCLLTIKSRTRGASVEIVNTGSKTNGVLIYLNSEVTDGWVIGVFRCDELGPIIDPWLGHADRDSKCYASGAIRFC